MANTRNHYFQNLSETRAYPFEASAQLVDDAGVKIPYDLIAGLNVSVPASAGKYIYVGAMSRTPALLTVILLATNDLDVVGVPVMSISQIDSTKHYNYSFDSIYPGSGGWISFGDASLDRYTGRFSSARQSLLSPKVAKAYAITPVTNAAVFGSTALTGVIRLAGGNDFEIVSECRSIPAWPVLPSDSNYCEDNGGAIVGRKVAVFRLVDKSIDQATDVLKEYASSCETRPESLNCGAPEPIQFIGSVAPDCNGNVTIEFRGCSEIVPLGELITIENDIETARVPACGVLINCNLGLAASCTNRDRLPSEDGTLPNEYVDLCTDQPPPPDPPDTPIPPTFSFDPAAAQANVDITLPRQDPLDTLGDFTIRRGAFDIVNSFYYADIVEVHEEAITSLDVSTRCVATYTSAPPAPNNFYRRAKCRLQLMDSGAASLHNAAVIANYKDLGSGLYSFYAAEIDWDGYYRGYKLFRISHFSGTQLTGLFHVAVPELELGHAYDVTLEVYPEGDEEDAWLVAKLEGVTNPAINITIGPLAISGYGPAAGLFGLSTNRAKSEFFHLWVENITEI